LLLRGCSAIPHFLQLLDMPTDNKRLIEILAVREQYREKYLEKRDPIAEDRMLWRAQSFRHLVHLLPGQRILEIGCGAGMLTRSLAKVSRGECPISAITFQPFAARPLDLPQYVEFLPAAEVLGRLGEHQFDLVIAQDLLDYRTCAWLTQRVHALLAPGGRAVFYESNPWNIFLRARRAVSRLFGLHDPRLLLRRVDLYELLSEVGFSRIFSVYNDFVYAPLTRHLAWFLRNMSIVLENTPFIRTLAGSILVYAEKPPRRSQATGPSMAVHPSLHQAVSVVVPCHNEEMNIGPLIAQLTSFFGDYIYEFILVNDNSEDQTETVINALAAVNHRIKPIHRRPPKGVGGALADGIRAATGQYLLLMDCDFQQLVPELRDLFDAAVEGNDVVIGSRFSRHSVLLNYPLQKIVANRAFHVLAQLLLLSRFRDRTNNLKLMRRQVAEQLQILEPGFAANAEIGLQPLIMGCKVKEVPVSWIGRGLQMGSSSFALLNAGGGYWRVLRRIWLCRFFGAGAYYGLRAADASLIEHRTTK
jgi:dolichol-phosphate mannosyltransferase